MQASFLDRALSLCVQTMATTNNTPRKRKMAAKVTRD